MSGKYLEYFREMCDVEFIPATGSGYHNSLRFGDPTEALRDETGEDYALVVKGISTEMTEIDCAYLVSVDYQLDRIAIALSQVSSAEREKLADNIEEVLNFLKMLT